MLSRRAWMLGLPFVVACKRGTPAKANGPLAPSESVDPSFEGCSRSCGLRLAKARAEARVQPGGARGDAVFCPVSGAVFRITDESPSRIAQGRVLYFCCEACAVFFAQHEAEVLAKRGIA